MLIHRTSACIVSNRAATITRHPRNYRLRLILCAQNAFWLAITVGCRVSLARRSRRQLASDVLDTRPSQAGHLCRRRDIYDNHRRVVELLGPN